MRDRKRVISFCITLIAVVMMLGLGNAEAQQKKFLSIGTGNSSGTYYFLGAGFASIWNKHIPGLKVVAESTAASAENLALVARGKMDMGFLASSSIVQKLDEGWDLSNVRILCSSMHVSHFHFIVRKDSPIKSWKDFRGKKISLGAPGSGTLVSSLQLFKALGYSKSDFDLKYLNFTETISAIQDNTIDVGLVAAGAPVAGVIDLALTIPIRLIPVRQSDFVTPSRVTSVYMDVVIPKGTYKGVAEDVPSLAAPTFIIVNKSMDNNTAYQLLKVLHEYEKERNRLHPLAKEYALDKALTGIAGRETLYKVPFHDGAIKYYKEKGVWPPKQGKK